MTTGSPPLPASRVTGPSGPSPRPASRVVVGADGSDEGWQAVAWGDHLARLLGGGLVVVAAWQVSTGLGLAGGGWAPLPAEWDPVADTTRDLREGTARLLGAERAGQVDLLVVEGHSGAGARRPRRRRHPPRRRQPGPRRRRRDAAGLGERCVRPPRALSRPRRPREHPSAAHGLRRMTAPPRGVTTPAAGPVPTPRTTSHGRHRRRPSRSRTRGRGPRPPAGGRGCRPRRGRRRRATGRPPARTR